MKHISTPAILALVCVSALLGTISAYAQNQTGTLEMLAGEPLTPPASPLNFSANFIPEVGTEKIYTVLDPALPENRLGVYDSLDSAGFNVHVVITDLSTADGNDVDYRNISIVTLSQSGTGVDADSAFNNPPGAPNVTAPIACDSWISSGGDTLATMDAKCGGIMDTAPSTFYELTPSSSVLTADANLFDTEIHVADGSQFGIPLLAPTYKVRIGNDIIRYSGIEGNTLTGVSGIDTTHLIGETALQHTLESGPLEIMQNLSPADTGLYSVGIGMRLTVDPTFKQGDYSGTLTFTFS